MKPKKAFIEGVKDNPAEAFLEGVRFRNKLMAKWRKIGEGWKRNE